MIHSVKLHGPVVELIIPDSCSLKQQSSLMLHDLFRILLFILWIRHDLWHSHAIQLPDSLYVVSICTSHPATLDVWRWTAIAREESPTLIKELSVISSSGRSCNLTIRPSSSDDQIIRVVWMLTLFAALGRGALTTNVCLKSTAISFAVTFWREPVLVVVGLLEMTVYASVLASDMTMGTLSSCPAILCQCLRLYLPIDVLLGHKNTMPPSSPCNLLDLRR